MSLLLTADLALPERDRLLDPARVRLPIEASSIEVVRCKYRVGESLRVLYRVATADGERLITVRASAGLAPRWWTFPDDRRLPNIAELMAPADDVVALVAGRSWTHSEVAEYAPERSLTVRAVDADGRAVAYVKHLPPGARDIDALAERYDHVCRALRVVGGVGAPRSLGRSAELGLVALAPVPGVRWTDLPAGHLPATAELMGRAIAALHGVPAPAGTPTFERLAPARLRRSAAVLAAARPDVAGEVGLVVDRLIASIPADEPVLLHGDCHPKNVIVDGDRLALIDLDQAGTGAAAADTGSLRARLRVATIIGGSGAGDEATLVDAFAAGYAAERGRPTTRSDDWHTAAALVAEQAVRAVNRLRPDVLAHLPEIVDAAHSLVPGRST
ncbi:MAG: aminoglycoside phosphotransferase family protein [Ilumatobacteraceae bacterium]